jgi:hypothetical protein
MFWKIEYIRRTPNKTIGCQKNLSKYNELGDLPMDYQIPLPEQIRIQRLEKKIKKLQNSNKRHRKNLEFYKRIVRDFPWIEPTSQTRKENIELTNELKLKGWTIKGLKHDLEYLDNYITDDMITTIEKSNAVYDPLVAKIMTVIKNIKKGINLSQIRDKNNNTISK